MGFLRTFINVFGRRQLSFSFRFPFVLRLPLQRLGANFVRAGRRVKAVHSSHPDGGNAVCRPGLLQAGPALQVLQEMTPATAQKQKDPPRALPFRVTYVILCSPRLIYLSIFPLAIAG